LLLLFFDPEDGGEVIFKGLRGVTSQKTKIFITEPEIL
jgi:hypothetical protein